MKRKSLKSIMGATEIIFSRSFNGLTIIRSERGRRFRQIYRRVSPPAQGCLSGERSSLTKKGRDVAAAAKVAQVEG